MGDEVHFSRRYSASVPRKMIFRFLLGATLAFSALSLAAADTPEQAFHRENSLAMQQMMADMHLAPSGDIDRDFATMMIAHHQGAIDMALAQLKYGKNPQLRRLAQEIIIEQKQEIEVMRLALMQASVKPTLESNSTVSLPSSTNSSHQHQ